MTSSRILTAVAVVSVILNLLLVGFFVGQRLPHFAAWHDGPPGFDRAFVRDGERDLPPPPNGDRRDRMRVIMGPNDLNLGAAMRTLDPETRKAMQAKFKSDMPEIRARVEEMAAKRRALLEVLVAEPADAERLSQALSDVRAAAAAAQEHSHKLFMEIAGGLPADQRAAFMKAAAEGRQPRAPR